MKHMLRDIVTEHSLGLIHRVRSAEPETAGKAPCLILLHGVGANEAGLTGFASRQDPRLKVILARGPLVFGPAQFGWFNVSFSQSGPKINAAQAEQSRRLLIEFIRRIPGAYDVDPARIWIAGFSQGGIMSASVALTAPKEVRGFGVLSGRILPEIEPLIADSQSLKQQHAFVAHGVHDQKLGIHFARRARALLEALHLPLTCREYDAGHELSDAMQSDFCDWMTRQLDVIPSR